jgi:carboxypeptidase Taq
LAAKELAAMNEPYARLRARFARIAVIEEAQAMLGWDAAAMMPPGGGAARGEQLAVLAGLAHDLLVAGETASWLAAADPGDDPWESANLALMRDRQRRAAALPGDLVEARARANSACEKTWREARATADFKQVLPDFTEVVRLARETATALGAALGLDPYDALMEGFQPGVRAADVAPIFTAYEGFLAEALPAAEARQIAPRKPEGPFPEAAQEALCRRMAGRAGLDFAHARLDRSSHPFCGGTPTDIRITTRYDEADFAQSLMGVMHETGHALYEAGLPAAYARQPVGQAAGMAVHESQSLIIEMQACRSDPFLGWLGPVLHETFGGAAAVYAPENLARLWRRVGRGQIRVDADELTYPAHVILRFRLERALIAGDLAPADLPAAWREGMAALLGITPRNDAEGCLQDIHWYDGAFGYFPSYTLGAMAAARAAMPGLDAALGAGDFAPLRGWLGTAIHGRASRFGFHDLLRAATGKPLDPEDFLAHLRRRYLGGE